MGSKKMKLEQMRSGTILALIKSSCNRNWTHDFSPDESVLEKQNTIFLQIVSFGNYSFLKVEKVEIFTALWQFNVILQKLNSCHGNY